MNRFIRAIAGVLALCLATAASGQGFSGLARLVPNRSGASDTTDGLSLTLTLSQGVPFRLFTLDAPERLVLDFKEVDWTGIEPDRFTGAKGVVAVRHGGFQPGWSRMVVDLAGPMIVTQANMRLDDISNIAELELSLQKVSGEAFAEKSRPPTDPNWAVPLRKPAQPVDPSRFTVVLDPGHGGIDPGAEREGEAEKDLMLTFARELREALLRVDGVDVIMTREDDSFVSLERRVALAHQAGADIFLSLHADALAAGHARGATIHTLSDEASDEASALLAERHNRTDILAGVDLTGKDDVVAGVLLDLARMETQPRADRLAHALVDSLRLAGAPLNRHPFRSASFSVLKAADIPSVLLELGFLSDSRDLENLVDSEWRARMAEALRDGIQAWMIADEAAKTLVRQ